jgi:hypothetical protein
MVDTGAVRMFLEHLLVLVARAASLASSSSGTFGKNIALAVFLSRQIAGALGTVVFNLKGFDAVEVTCGGMPCNPVRVDVGTLLVGNSLFTAHPPVNGCPKPCA